MITDKHTGQAFLSLWFGNFYRPAYDDRDFICQAMGLIKDLGFNTILLDSKAWEDFQERFQGKDASPYVAMQEFMMEEATRHNLSYEFLSLYLNGDNLYPHIRFSPPCIRGFRGECRRLRRKMVPLLVRKSQRLHGAACAGSDEALRQRAGKDPGWQSGASPHLQHVGSHCGSQL